MEPLFHAIMQKKVIPYLIRSSPLPPIVDHLLKYSQQNYLSVSPFMAEPYIGASWCVNDIIRYS